MTANSADSLADTQVRIHVPGNHLMVGVLGGLAAIRALISGEFRTLPIATLTCTPVQEPHRVLPPADWLISLVYRARHWSLTPRAHRLWSRCTWRVKVSKGVTVTERSLGE